MYRHTDTYTLKTAANQSLESGCPPLLGEPVYIQVQKILDQVALRKQVTRNIALIPSPGIYRPDFTFSGVDNFSIVYVKLISKIDLDKKANLKKLGLVIGVKYNLIYSDGTNHLIQPDEAVFDVTINKAYYPSLCIRSFSRKTEGSKTYISKANEPIIEVEASGCSSGDILCCCTGALIVDIGAFFIIRFLQESEICIPAYETYEQKGV